MRCPELAVWIEENRETILVSGQEGRGPEVALIDHILAAARTGQVDEFDSIIRQTVRQAVEQEIPLDRLLRQPLRLKAAIWKELKQQGLPPSQTIVLIEATEAIFSHLIRRAARFYFQASQQMQDALASEIARLYAESERLVLDRTADLTRANIELSKLEQAKTDFISIAAHELKTPLTLIQGYANMLNELELEADVARRTHHLLEGISRGVGRLGAIVEDMLDVSVIDSNALSLRIERVSLANAVKLVVSQNANHFTERGLTIHVGDLASLPTIEVDRHRLHQILIHVLNNAVKYTPDGGDVFIEGRVLPDGGLARENPSKGAKYVELTFRDTGIGIAPEDRERIFEKFYRVGKSTLHSSGKVKFKGAGPGLGLPIARGLIEAHGGRLWAESPGHDEVNFPGSTFYLLLPIQAMPKPGINVTWSEAPPNGIDEQSDE